MIKNALTALKPIVQQVSKLIILQSPFRSHEQFLRRLTYKPFEHQIRAQQTNKPDDDVNILLYRIDMKRMFSIFLRQTGSLDNLHLMNLQNIKRKRRNDRSLTETLLRIFSWQPDDNMTASQDAASMRTLYRITAAGKSCPRLMRRKVSSFALSIPYSTNKNVRLLSFSR